MKRPFQVYIKGNAIKKTFAGMYLRRYNEPFCPGVYLKKYSKISPGKYLRKYNEKTFPGIYKRNVIKRPFQVYIKGMQ
jgi:hypothetical protein